MALWRKGTYVQVSIVIVLVSGGKTKLMETCPESITPDESYPPLECWPMSNRFCYCVHLNLLVEFETKQVVSDWRTALASCAEINMTLVSVESQEKNNMLEYFVAEFLGKSFAQFFWTGGAYNQNRERFAWFDTLNEKVTELDDFNYTNWDVGYPPRNKKLTGDECVLFNCTRRPCKWEVWHCTVSISFICESPLFQSYAFPGTTKRPKLRNFTGPISHNRSSGDQNLWIVQCCSTYAMLFYFYYNI